MESYPKSMWGIQVQSPKLKPSIKIGLHDTVVANESAHKIINYSTKQSSIHFTWSKFLYEYISMNHESFNSASYVNYWA